MRTFTFGFDHKHPIAGTSLAKHYIQVPGDGDESREVMLAVFGRDWSMQYTDPSKLRYLESMHEVPWTAELFERGRANATPMALRVLNEYALELAKTEEINAYFDTMSDLPPVTTITGTPVLEYAHQLALGSKQLIHGTPEIERIYPVAKQLRHAITYGGRVFRRRVLVVEDWVEVTKEEADALCKPYDEREVDLTPKNEGTILP